MTSTNFLSDDDSDIDIDNGIRINKKFAIKFEEREKNKDIRKAATIDSDEDEESESEDDDADLLSPKLELQIINAINSIRKMDPRIYDKKSVWFDDNDSDSNEDNVNVNDNDTKEHKKMTYKDVLREQLLNDPSASKDVDDKEVDLSGTLSKHRLVYNTEQETLRRQFLKSIQQSQDNASSDHDSDDGLLKIKNKDLTDIVADRIEIEQALNEMQILSKRKPNQSKSIPFVLDNHIDENIDDFLTEYISKQKWKDRSMDSIDQGNEDHSNVVENSVHHDPIELDTHEDESEVEAAELFESKYNFRFEELQDEEGLRGLQVTGHSRNVSESLRRIDDKRKQQREMLKERKEKEKRQKEAEIRRLKNLKRQELRERLMKIGEVGGLKDIAFDEGVLDEDWDPQKHDDLMNNQFGYQYYEGEDYEFPQSDEVNEWLLQDDDYPDEGAAADENTLPEISEKRKKKKKNDNSKKDMDVEELLTSTSKFNSTSGKLAKSMLDELYQLDYEDVVAGIPCRFKYKEVDPDDFGLSTEEILMADDKELNELVSLKKLSAYNKKGITERDRLKIAKKRRKLRKSLKERLATNPDDELTSTSVNTFLDTELLKYQPATQNIDAPKRKRKRHKSKRQDDSRSNSEEASEGDHSEPDGVVISTIDNIAHKTSKPKRRKNALKSKPAVGEDMRRLSLYT